MILQCPGKLVKDIVGQEFCNARLFYNLFGFSPIRLLRAKRRRECMYLEEYL